MGGAADDSHSTAGEHNVHLKHSWGVKVRREVVRETDVIEREGEKERERERET